MKNKKLTQRKNQLVLISLLMFFVTLVIVSVLMTPVIEFISVGVNATNGTTHGDLIALLMNYIPVFIVIVLLVSLFSIISGR